MGSLKNHVKNCARPEASIARGYLLDETMGFITSYMDGFDVVKRWVWEADPEDSDEYELVEGASTNILLLKQILKAAHMYVLRNNTLMVPYYR